jgi:AbrB family looped-hinge helix DNA binding protein
MRITSKGQVTIPQEIREQCGLLPHTQLRFVVEDGRVLSAHLYAYRLIPREAAFLAARAHAEYRARPAPPLDSPIEQPQGLAAASHRLAAQAAFEANQPAAVVHRQGQQVGVSELAPDCWGSAGPGSAAQRSG